VKVGYFKATDVFDIVHALRRAAREMVKDDPSNLDQAEHLCDLAFRINCVDMIYVEHEDGEE
jgi:hypothetical protein